MPPTAVPAPAADLYLVLSGVAVLTTLIYLIYRVNRFVDDLVALLEDTDDRE